MNQNNEPNLADDNTTAPIHPDAPQNAQPPVIGRTPVKRLSSLLLLLLLFVTLRLVLFYVPQALSWEWFWDGGDGGAKTGGCWWDYPCVGCPCPPGSNEPNWVHADSPAGGPPGSGGGGGGGGGGGLLSLAPSSVAAGDGAGPGGCAGCGGMPAAGGGGGGDSCNNPCGMPVWWVSEAAMTLWLKDIPMSHQPSRGEPIQFQLLYKESSAGDDRVSQTSESQYNYVFGVGQNWSTPWCWDLRNRRQPELRTGSTAGAECSGHIRANVSSLNYRDHSLARA